MRQHVSSAHAEAAAALREQGAMLPVTLHPPCSPERARTQEPPCPPPVRGRALIDPGAHMSWVSREAADRLALRRVGEVGVSGVTGAATYPTVVADMSFDGLFPRTVLVAGASPAIGEQGFDVLFGRDALKEARLVYDGPRGAFGIAPADATAELITVRPRAAVRWAPLLMGLVLGVTATAGVWALSEA